MSSTRKPGAAWIEIIGRQSPKAFAEAFTATPWLEASVLDERVTGTLAIRAFFGITRKMYDSFRFVREASDESREFLEWTGTAFGEDVSGLTILDRDASGKIQSVRLYHQPLALVLQCAKYIEACRSIELA